MKKSEDTSLKMDRKPLTEEALSSRIYRVQAGQYRTREEAEQAAERLCREGGQAFVYRIRVGKISSRPVQGRPFFWDPAQPHKNFQAASVLSCTCRRGML